MMLLYNGQLTDSQTTVISALDHGFLYGMGLFETFRTYGGKPWLLERHAARMRDGCAALGIVYEPDVARLQDAVARLLEANGLSEGYIRWSVSAGEGAIGLPAEPYERPNEIVYAKAQAEDRPETRQGKPLRLLRQPRSTPEGDIRLKSFHYMNNILAKRELTAAGAAPGTEGLFLDRDGHVVEGMVSNVFWVSNGVVHTPSVDTGLLPGVTRGFVLELAAEMGLRTEARSDYRWEDALAADEAFLTSSIQEVVPVSELVGGPDQASGRRFDGIGPVTSELMRAYRLRAERDSTR